ncbi:MAG: PH domain-containing protein [Phycisphaerales bacterium]
MSGQNRQTALPVPPGMVGPDERVILAFRPSLWYILLWRAETLAGLIIAAAAGRWAAERGLGILSRDPRIPVALGLAAVALVLIWLLLDWSTHVFVLTNRRVVRRVGILRRLTTEAPITNLQSVSVAKSIRERIFGLGTLLFNTAGGPSPTGRFAWVMVAQPESTLSTVRRAIDDARSVMPLPGALT